MFERLMMILDFNSGKLMLYLVRPDYDIKLQLVGIIEEYSEEYSQTGSSGGSNNSGRKIIILTSEGIGSVSSIFTKYDVLCPLIFERGQTSPCKLQATVNKLSANILSIKQII